MNIKIASPLRVAAFAAALFVVPAIFAANPDRPAEVLAAKDPKAYAGKLGELRLGRNNFSFERYDDLKADGVSSLFAEIARIFERDPQNPVEYMQGA